MIALAFVLRWSLILVSTLGVSALLGLLGVVMYILPGLPSIAELDTVKYHVPLRIYSADGKLVAEYGAKRRIPLRIEEIPDSLKQAVVAAEDANFYHHPGVDYKGLLRAVGKLITTGEKVQGGSTITMQVARNFFLNRERTYSRKLREILLAFQIEKRLSKAAILALYLNQNYMGNRAYGVGAAAHTYYGVNVDELALPQIAMLAGLYKAPSKYNPVVNPERALLRRNYVLRRMLEQGDLRKEQADQARAAPLTARLHSPRPGVEANYVAEMVRSKMYAQFGDAAYSSGLKVTTTIESQKQVAAIGALRNNLQKYDLRHGYRGAEHQYDLDGLTAKELDALLANHSTYGGLRPALVLSSNAGSASVYLGKDGTIELPLKELEWARAYINEDERGPKPERVDNVLKQGDLIRLRRSEQGWSLAQIPAVGGALVSLAAEDGRILALSGGFDYYHSRFNRAIQAVRQPGSNFKPFIYSAALAQGLTPATIFNDAPIVHSTEIAGKQKLWRPENYSGQFFGPTRMRMALAKSRNLVSIRLLRAVGVYYTLRHIKKFAMTKRPMPADLSLSLGSGSLTPLELASGYAVFANQGYRVEPYFISKIEGMNGESIYEHMPQVACKAPCEQLITPDALKHDPDQDRNGKKLGVPAAHVLDKYNVYQTVSMMRDVIRIGTGRKARKLKRRDLAGKTGTTNDQKDAWFSGFNQDIVTTVWVGFDRTRPLGKKETGGNVALPVWMDYMRIALETSPDRAWIKPPGMITMKIDAETGLKAGPQTKQFVFETFRPGKEPVEGFATLAPIEGVDVPEQIF